MAQPPAKDQQTPGGVLDIRIIEARGLKKASGAPVFSPNVLVKVGPTIQKTESAPPVQNQQGPGYLSNAAPKWTSSPFRFQLAPGQFVAEIKVCDNEAGKQPEVIGENSNVNLQSVIAKGFVDIGLDAFDISGKVAGQIHLQMQFTPAGQAPQPFGPRGPVSQGAPTQGPPQGQQQQSNPQNGPPSGGPPMQPNNFPTPGGLAPPGVPGGARPYNPQQQMPPPQQFLPPPQPQQPPQMQQQQPPQMQQQQQQQQLPPSLQQQQPPNVSPQRPPQLQPQPQPQPQQFQAPQPIPAPQPAPVPNSNPAPSQPPIGPTPPGTLEVQIVEARNLRSPTINPFKADTYVGFKVGDVNLVTATAKDGGSNPRYTQQQPFKYNVVTGLHTASVEVVDDNLLRGAETIARNPNVSILPALQQGRVDMWVDVFDRTGANAGQIHLIARFVPATPAAAPPQPVAVPQPVPPVPQPAAPVQPPAHPATQQQPEDYEQLKAEVMRQRVLLLAMTTKSKEIKDHLREARDRMRSQAQEHEQREVQLEARIKELEKALHDAHEDPTQNLTRSRLASVMRDSMQHMEERDEARRQLELERQKNGNGAEVAQLRQQLEETRSRLHEAHAALERATSLPPAIPPPPPPFASSIAPSVVDPFNGNSGLNPYSTSIASAYTPPPNPYGTHVPTSSTYGAPAPIDHYGPGFGAASTSIHDRASSYGPPPPVPSPYAAPDRFGSNFGAPSPYGPPPPLSNRGNPYAPGGYGGYSHY